MDPLLKISEIVNRQKRAGLPPVESWNPERSGEIDIHIAADGYWHYQRKKMARPELARLFSTIVRKDPDGYCLVTPVERLKISVEDVPFAVIDWELQGTGDDAKLVATTLTGDSLTVEQPSDWELRQHTDGEWHPYMRVRRNLWARFSRAAYYRLVQHAEVCEGRAAIPVGTLVLPLEHGR